MRIERIRLEGFGRFDTPIEVRFDGGMNIVLGPNESGKSTLLEAVIGILFGLRDKAAEERLAPAGGGPFRGEVDLASEKEKWQVVRDFATHRVSVTRRAGSEATIVYQGEANPRGRTDDLDAYLAALERCLGVTDRDITLKTLFMRQGELETDVDEQIRSLLSGSPHGDYEAVLGRLEERYFSLTRENPWGSRRKNRPREIEELEEKIGSFGERLERARSGFLQGGSLRIELEEAQGSLATIREESEQKGRLLESIREFFELNRERGELEKRLRVLREEKEKVKGLTADSTKAREDLEARFGAWKKTGPDFGDSLKGCSTLEREVASLTDELKQREADLAANPWPRQTKRSLIVGGAIAVILSLALLGAGVGPVSIAIGIVVGVLAIVGLYFLSKGKEQERMRLEAAVVEMADRIEKQKGELKRLEEAVRPVIGTKRPTEALEEWRAYQEMADLASRREQIRASHRTLADVTTDYDQVFDKLKLADARARDLIARSPFLAGADQNLDEVATRIDTLGREHARLVDAERVANERMADLKLRRARQEGGQVDDVESLEDELAESRERLTALRFRRDAFRLATEVLRDCILEFQEGHVDRLAHRAGEIFARLTGGRWGRITLDRAFIPRVIDTAGRTFTVDALSRGARDQLHLALRIAVVEEVFATGSLPLILDDVLVHCDDERRVAIRALLADEVSRGRQVILLSHGNEYADWGTVAVRLALEGAAGGESHGRRSSRASAAPTR